MLTLNGKHSLFLHSFRNQTLPSGTLQLIASKPFKRLPSADHGNVANHAINVDRLCETDRYAHRIAEMIADL